MAKLNGKQAKFVAEKVKDPTISNTEAAKRAGYKPSSAREVASRLSTKVNIAEKLKVASEAVIERAIGTAEEADNMLWSKLTETYASDKKEREFTKLLELFYKRRALLNENINLTNSDGSLSGRFDFSVEFIDASKPREGAE